MGSSFLASLAMQGRMRCKQRLSSNLKLTIVQFWKTLVTLVSIALPRQDKAVLLFCNCYFILNVYVVVYVRAQDPLEAGWGSAIMLHATSTISGLHVNFNKTYIVINIVTLWPSTTSGFHHHVFFYINHHSQGEWAYQLEVFNSDCSVFDRWFFFDKYA